MKLFKFKYLLVALAFLVPSQAMGQNATYVRDLANAIYAASGLNNGDMYVVNKFGHNDDVDIANPADLWSGGSQTAAGNRIYVYGGFISTGDSLQVVSTSANDSTGNGGASVLEIQGLDTLWALQTVSVTLTGTDTLVVSDLFLRVFGLKVTAGFTTDPDTSINQGKIIVNTFTGNTRMAQIEIGKNQSQMAIYTIPAGYTGYLMNYNASLEKSTPQSVATDVELFIRPFGQVFQMKDQHGMASDGTSHVHAEFNYPLVITQKSDIKLRVFTADDAVDVSGGFTLVVVKH